MAAGFLLYRDLPTLFGPNPFLNVPEWEAMTVRLAGGDLVDIDLRRLSWEQRQSVWEAIVVRAKLVQVT